MDAKLKDLKVLKIAKGFAGPLKDFKGSLAMVEICEQQQVIAKSVMPAAIPREPVGLRDRYFNHLCRLAVAFLKENPTVRSWEDFCASKTTRQVTKVFFEFGVKAEVFDRIPEGSTKASNPASRTKVTLDEVYELCTIKFNYSGGFSTFKRLICEHYGSFAEYCLQKGYDLNHSKWDDKDVAIRCAQKLGSIEAIQARSSTLYNYLNDNNLLRSLKSA
jgi:hypothetical protein